MVTNELTTSPAAPAFRDLTLSLEDRVQDLLSRLTLDEKISQMTNEAAAIPRLGIPAYNFWNEGLHGVARNGRATVFPQAIGMAATWDPDLIRRIAAAIGDEARAKYHDALRRNGSTEIYQGLTIWSPNINIFRDPRWGRGQETWGEDPFLTGEMGRAFVCGLQGDDPRYLKTAACAKHYAVHSGPEKDRHHFNAQVSLRDLHDTYLPAFKKLVSEAGVEAVMGAYNRTNGEPSCASPFLLGEILREKWGFQGHVVSDCWALSDIHLSHHITNDAAESAALALKAGCDMSCMCTYDYLGEAVERGLISEADIDRSLARTLRTRFKLGMFDPVGEVPYTSIPLFVVNSLEHRQLAQEAALKSIVLLKNRDNILPIGSKVRSIAVVGPNAASADILLGNYYGTSDTLSTLLEGIAGCVPEGVRVEYLPGSLLAHRRENPINWAVDEASRADITIACMGLSPMLEGEEGESLLAAEKGDRTEIELPQAQVDYVRQLVEAGARVVLVLSGGSPIALGELENMVEAIVFIWYPGQEGGRAVADVLFGRAAPSGRLPVTFPQSTSQLPPFEEYAMAGRTYRYATAEPLFPFGFGLSYTCFAYSDLDLEQTRVRAGEGLSARLQVTNSGTVEAEEVVQCYLSDLEASSPVPGSHLVGFQRVYLRPGERCPVTFQLTPEMMMFIDEEGEPRLEAGQFRLTVGGCSPGKRGRALGAPEPLSAEFTLEA